MAEPGGEAALLGRTHEYPFDRPPSCTVIAHRQLFPLAPKHANSRPMPRIHILGASGSGTSTLGSALARRLEVLHADSDSFYWLPTDPLYTTPRPPEERQALLLRTLSVTGHWVFSGAATKWAAPLEPYYDLVVFLRLDPAVRMTRLRRREATRFGDRILPGGDMATVNAAFIAWAESYDTAGSLRRGLVTHEAWLADQPAPVLRLDSEAPVENLVAAVLSWFGR
jgi:adenylate kinase family enzyme